MVIVHTYSHSQKRHAYIYLIAMFCMYVCMYVCMRSCSQLPSGVLQYEDYITAARRTARFLRESGAEVVLAITHNRLSNDVALTQAVPEIDLLLGNILSYRCVCGGVSVLSVYVCMLCTFLYVVFL